MQAVKQHWDQNGVRYRLLKSVSGQNYNWLFFPGGPGFDSRYLLSLVNGLTLPGKIWLIDLPFNGDNLVKAEKDYDYNLWFDYLVPSIKNFSDPIFVGHSFGGMFPLLFPELENILKGFVVLNSTPALWLEAAAQKAKEKDIPILTEPMEEFSANPNDDTFKNALMACLPYYFPSHSIEQGRSLLANVPMNFNAAVWWINKAVDMKFNAKWVPKRVPTLIIGGTEDCITPFHLFANDPRFNKPNILLEEIKGAGHLPWIEKSEAVQGLFNSFFSQLELA